ncbi:MFS transporter [Arthrobacter sp. GMC3]|uniref:MFS transporter n=1 Tax=Arthrobacter sp. GMC3 TaxID=2058894 RepID=UPI000CE33E5C|nr:MFS transporter [Arthrobacter sp. GMC3]
MNNSRALAQITLGVLIQVLAVSTWFATAAAVPSLVADFGLGPAQKALLTAVVQLGFALGAVLVGLLRLSDRVAPSVVVPLGALATGAFTLLPLFNDESLLLLIVSRGAVGLCLAAVYPPGMRATVSWSAPRWRGLAVSTMVAALTLGTAAPYLLTDSPLNDWRQVLIVSAIAAAIAALLALKLRNGPHVLAVGTSTLADLFRLARDPAQRRITIAYIAHMWEVYGLWVWLPMLLVTLPAFAAGSPTGVGFAAFTIIGVAGTLGCLLGGALAGVFGKRLVARCSVAISMVCALASPLLGVMPSLLAIAILLAWGISVISDSPLYSAMTGDASGGRAVGTAIALQMGIGYFMSIGAIYFTALAGAWFGWQFAFLPLAIGPLISFIALRRQKTVLQGGTAPGRADFLTR